MNDVFAAGVTDRASSPGAPLRTALAGLILLSVSLIAYSPVLNGYFLADDFGYVQLYMGQRLAGVPRLFAADWSQGIFGFNLHELRPVIALSYMWDALLWKANPLGYHVTNVLFHAANSLLVFTTMRLLLRADSRASLVGGLLFAVHPVHAGAVSWIAGRTDVISTFFYLSSFLAFALYRASAGRRMYVLSILLFALALFSKELALSLPLMLIAYDLIYRGTTPGSSTPESARSRRRWAPHVGYAAVVLGYLCLRKLAFGRLPGRGGVRSFVMRQGEYLSHLFPPVDQLVGVVGDEWLLLLWVVPLVVLGVLWLRDKTLLSRVWPSPSGAVRHILFFGLAWYAISVIPLMATYVSPRHLYLPSFGLCVTAGLVLRFLPSGRASGIAAALLVALYGAQLLAYNGQWRKLAQRSAQMRNETRELLRDVPPGSAIIFNTPAFMQGKHVWTWVMPYVLREPFSGFDAYRRFRVIDAPYNYCCSWADDRLPALTSMIDHPVETYVIYLDRSNHLVKKKLSAEQVRRDISDLTGRQGGGADEPRKVDDAAIVAGWENFWAARAEAAASQE